MIERVGMILVAHSADLRTQFPPIDTIFKPATSTCRGQTRETANIQPAVNRFIRSGDTRVWIAAL
jgi:hypothetical protein